MKHHFLVRVKDNQRWQNKQKRARVKRRQHKTSRAKGKEKEKIQEKPGKRTGPNTRDQGVCHRVSRIWGENVGKGLAQFWLNVVIVCTRSYAEQGADCRPTRHSKQPQWPLNERPLMHRRGFFAGSRQLTTRNNLRQQAVNSKQRSIQQAANSLQHAGNRRREAGNTNQEGRSREKGAACSLQPTTQERPSCTG